MDANDLLLWEKWRPKTMESIILLPRIRRYFEDGLKGNYIFYGNWGTGKTSLARILIGKYIKDRNNYIEINSSFYTSIEILRKEIEDFCKFKSMMDDDYDTKYVFLDEFERTSGAFQDAFKAFVEKYSKRGVRFIITTNNIKKINGGLLSRIPQINFNSLNIEEEKYLKTEIYKRLRDTILPEENANIPKEDLVKIITKKFPDFRGTLVEVENYLETKTHEEGSSNISNSLKNDLYRTIYDKNLDYEKIYHFIMSKFGPEKVSDMVNLLGKPFIDYSIANNKNIDNLFKCNFIIADYFDKLETSSDPIIIAMTIIGKFREILIN